MANLRQKLAIQKVLESKGKKSVSAAMVEAGYPETTAHNPQQLTRSKAWKELVDKHVKDEKLLRTLNNGLDANRVISARVTNKNADVDTDDFIEVPDHMARHRYLETGLKIKGYLRDGVMTGPVIVPVIIKRGYGRIIEGEGDNAASETV